MTVVVVALLTWLLAVAPEVRAETPTPLLVPDVPPIASLIQVSIPDPAGDVTVTGTSGSVPGGSRVALVTLDTGHVAAVQAAGDGSFNGSLFAPAGTSIMVKADPTGLSIARLIQDIQRAGVPNITESLSALPGTILPVAAPPASGGRVPVAGAGLPRFSGGQSPLPAFTFDGSLSTQAVQPGGALRVLGTVRIVSPSLQGAGAMQAAIKFRIDRLSGPDGAPSLARNSFGSVFLTPTGLPIERLPRYVDDGLDSYAVLDMVRVAPDRAVAAVDMTLVVPPSFLAGYYRPYLDVAFTGVPVESPPLRIVVHIDRALLRGFSVVRLPIVRVGNPAPPRLPWTLLTDSLSNGTRGTRAIEDRDRFGLAPHIQTQSETFIVPRLDVTSGQPFRYRLEPYLPTVCLGDQSPPAPPLIPLRLPSGRLTVRIQKPDGTVQVVGPAPFVQLRVKSLADPGMPDLSSGNILLDSAGGHLTDACELSTMDPRFEVAFALDGLHVITLEGSVQDVWGTVWSGGGTYEVHVARTLSVDTAVLPGMPFEVGDVFTPGVVLSPPVPAELEVRFRLAPGSDPGRMVERVVRGRANRFGYFHPVTPNLRGGIREGDSR